MIIKGKNYFKIGLVATVAGILDEKNRETSSSSSSSSSSFYLPKV